MLSVFEVTGSCEDFHMDYAYIRMLIQDLCFLVKYIHVQFYFGSSTAWHSLAY